MIVNSKLGAVSADTIGFTNLVFVVRFPQKSMSLKNSVYIVSKHVGIPSIHH